VAAVSQAILQSLSRDGPNPDELARAKAVVAAQLLMGAESPMARAEARASQVFLRDGLESFATLRDRIDAVTADQVRAVAAQAVSSAIAGAVIGPKTGLKALQGLSG
jgi:predicted Zn-dependent peptidase